jgi:hypothetical protein
LLHFCFPQKRQFRARQEVQEEAERNVLHYKLEKFGIITKGEHRVINEFQNGDIYMIEKNKPIDFVGEVTILPITAARGFFDLSAARLYLKAGGADGH